MDIDSAPLIESEKSSDLSKNSSENPSFAAESGDVARQQTSEEHLSGETPSKVQKTSGLFGVFSNFASGLTSASQTVLDQAREATKSVQKSLEDHTIIGGFNKMQSEFIQEKQSRDKGHGAAPWVGDQNEQELKNQILNLSQDKRNFMRDPPAGANFEFDLENCMPVARELLREDPELEKRRFELVPKALTENTFWRNYFYRISLIKQSSMLTSASPDDLKLKSNLDRDDISVASNLDLMDGSVVGDSDTHAEEHQVVLPSNPPSLKPSAKRTAASTAATKGADENWEKELQQTLDSYEVVGGEMADNEVDQALAATDDHHMA